jgi:hypothetical protein
VVATTEIEPAWDVVRGEEHAQLWDRFEDRFSFRPHAWAALATGPAASSPARRPVFAKPDGSITFDLEGANHERWSTWTVHAVNALVVRALAEVIGDPAEPVLVLDWQHPAPRVTRVVRRVRGSRDAGCVLVVDAANVIGSRPTGWWRDRPGAARGLVERVRAAVTAGRLDPPVTLVLEGRARSGADETIADGVEVVHASGAGDDAIVALADALDEVVVVTADRGLAQRVRAANGEVVKPTWLLDKLGE